jgi:hypothetical protein
MSYHYYGYIAISYQLDYILINVYMGLFFCITHSLLFLFMVFFLFYIIFAILLHRPPAKEKIPRIEHDFIVDLIVYFRDLSPDLATETLDQIDKALALTSRPLQDFLTFLDSSAQTKNEETRQAPVNESTMLLSALYWAAHLLQRSLSEGNNEGNMPFVSYMSFLLTRTLFRNADLVDRVSSQEAVRPLLGRILLMCSIASVRCMEYDVSAALWNLDTIARWRTVQSQKEQSKVSYYDSMENFWQFVGGQLQIKVEKSLRDDEVLKTISRLQLQVTEAEKTCGSAMKNALRHFQESSEAIAIPDTLQQLWSLPKDDTVFDGRIAFRRWSAVALVWLCQGPDKILRHALKLIQSDAHAEGYCLTTEDFVVSSSVCVSAIASRMIKVVSDLQSSVGVRCTSTSIEAYITRILGPTKSKRAKGQPKYARSDMRDVCAVLAYYIIDKHAQDIVRYTKDSNVLVVNDSKTGEVTAANIYPFVNTDMKTLIRIAKETAESSSECQSDFEVLITAYSLRAFAPRDVPLDPALLHISLATIAKLMKSEEESGKSSEEKDNSRVEGVLPIPVLSHNTSPVAKALAGSTSSRKRKSNTSTSMIDAATSYGGVVLARPGQGPASDQHLSFLIRALGGESEAFVSFLLTVAERCYDTRNMEQTDIATCNSHKHPRLEESSKPSDMEYK